MSAPIGNPNPYQPGQAVGQPGAASPQLLSDANTAFNMAIGGIVLGVCCFCALGALILGILSMNKANGVLAMAPMGTEANSKASTAKMLAIVALVIAGLQFLFNIIAALSGALGGR